MPELRQIELSEQADEEASVERFCRLAEAFVIDLGADDRFHVTGRLHATQVRDVMWTPADGPRALLTMVADYREYFESIAFPALSCAPDENASVHAHGVGLRLLTVRGAPDVAERIVALAAAVESGTRPTADLASADPRQRRMALFAMLWPGARGTRDSRALAADITTALRHAIRDGDARVRATALTIAARYRILAMADDALPALEDPDPSVRLAALSALRAFDDGGAVPPALRLLRDPDAHVRREAFAVARHVGHMPWARRKALVGPQGDDLAAAWPLLDAPSRRQGLDWLAGSSHEAAVRAAVALRDDSDALTRGKAVEVLATLEHDDAVAGLVSFLDDSDEDVLALAVEALTSEHARTVLHASPPLRERVMARLAPMADGEGAAPPSADESMPS